MKNRKERNTDWGGFFGTIFGKGSASQISSMDEIRNAKLSSEDKKILLAVLEEQEKSESARFKENLKAVKEWNTRAALSKNKVNYRAAEVNNEQKGFNKDEIAD